MKRRKLFVATLLVALLAIASFNNLFAQHTAINPECPNGCVKGGSGCYCYDWYEGLAEKNWGGQNELQKAN